MNNIVNLFLIEINAREIHNKASYYFLLSFSTTDDMPGSVSENDLMKAEDIQPNEMKGINSFLKDSNHVDKPESDQMISDGMYII